eukprot:820525-Pleurochrysis_carterae.AAC.1
MRAATQTAEVGGCAGANGGYVHQRIPWSAACKQLCVCAQVHICSHAQCASVCVRMWSRAVGRERPRASVRNSELGVRQPTSAAFRNDSRTRQVRPVRIFKSEPMTATMPNFIFRTKHSMRALLP